MRALSRNVAALVDSPKVGHVEIRPWRQEEAEAFLKNAKSDRLAALFSVALALGLRKA